MSKLYFMVINQILTNDICLAVWNWKVRYVGGNRISYSAEGLTSLERNVTARPLIGCIYDNKLLKLQTADINL